MARRGTTLRVAFTAAATLLGLAPLAACGSQGKSGSSAPSSISAAAPNAASTGAPVSAGPPCGPAAAETLAHTVGLVATRIYAGELSSPEVVADQSQVTHYQPLLSAVASGDRAATEAAVTTLVFSHTHVVRLRVTRAGSVLADVGGPRILAPVRGSLRLGGRTVGHYVLSVQDDLGYVKLVTRFIGIPLVLREGPHTLGTVGALFPGPASIPAHGPVSYRGRSYQAFSFNASSFPSGPLRISLLAPVVRSLALSSCAQIKLAELGYVARRISRRFSLSPSNFSSYIKATQPLTGGLLYIRAGSRQLAASTLPGPRTLPERGTVNYRGRTFGVFSFATTTTVGPVRIYELVPQ